MRMQSCPRLWEVEAARDGRLQGAPHAEFLRHVAQCRECEHERMALSRLQQALRASTPADDALQLRRVRQRMLAAANERLLGEGSERGFSGLPWRALSVSFIGALALSGLWLYRSDAWNTRASTAGARAHQTEPVALRLSADSGARFEHERRGDLEYIMLHEGGLHVAFDRSLHARLSVQTPDGDIEDIGTVFHVEVEAGYTKRIRVSEGAVRFRRAGQPDVMLTAGQVFERTAYTAARPEDRQAAHADLPAHAAPAARPTTHARAKTQPEPSGMAEDRAYLEVLDLLHVGHQEEARAAARRYCRNHPDGLRQKEMQRLARSTQP